jgi:Tfp pilus assembly protein PilZ
VATIRSLPVGHRVTVRLSTTPGDPKSVAALAEVRWTRPFAGSDDRPAGLGLRFIDTPVRTAILVSELQQRSGQPGKL